MEVLRGKALWAVISAPEIKTHKNSIKVAFAALQRNGKDRFNAILRTVEEEEWNEISLS